MSKIDITITFDAEITGWDDEWPLFDLELNGHPFDDDWLTDDQRNEISEALISEYVRHNEMMRAENAALNRELARGDRDFYDRAHINWSREANR